MTPEEIKAEMARLQEMLDAQTRTEGPEADAAKGKGKGAKAPRGSGRAEGAAGQGEPGDASQAGRVVDDLAKPAQTASDLPVGGETVGESARVGQTDPVASTPQPAQTHLAPLGEKTVEAEESAVSICQPVSQGYNIGGGGIVETSTTALRTREELERSLRMETVVEACRRLSEGQSLRTVSNDPDMPSMGTFLRWAHDDAEIGQMYMVALRLRAAGLAEEIIDLSDEADRAESSHEVQAYKLRVEARKWVASRLLPKQYGEKVEHEHSGEVKMDAQAVDARLQHLVDRIRGIPQSKVK